VKTLFGALVVLASLALAAPASAAPELFVRTQSWDTHEDQGPWLPLASAPAMNYLGGYQVGYKVESATLQGAALTVTGAPDGAPTQPYNDPPACVNKLGSVGEIVEVGSEVQFEGDGTYSVKVSVGAPNDLAACLSGVSSAGSFTVPTTVAPLLIGRPFVFRAKPLAGNPFVGVRAADPPGGSAELRCTLGSTVVPDPDVADLDVSEDDFTRPGRWSCAARGTAEGRDLEFERVIFGTPFSAPAPVDVRSDFRRRTGKVSKQSARRPLFSFKAEWPGLSKGGKATVTVSRVRGCKGKRFKLKRFGTFRGTFGAKNAQVRFKRPQRNGFYLGRFAFSGTQFIRAAVDPNPMYLQVSSGRLGFASTFPHCS
jgi:hypothetical protein